MVFESLWARICIIDDNASQAETMANAIEASGYTVKIFTSPRSFINSFHHDSFDLILIDWLMPELNGLEVIRHVRERDRQVPIIMVTCCAEDADALEGLEAGADDYLVKPVKLPLLVARIKAFLRRVRATDTLIPHHFALGLYRFDPDSSAATFGDQTVVLTNREFALARLLFTHPHRAFSRQYLLEALWGTSPDVQTRTLDTHVARLRTKLALGKTNGVRLTTLYGYGYRLEPVRAETEPVG